MFQIACEYQEPWLEGEPLNINLQLSGNITISPDLAQRKVNGFLAGYVTMMVSGGEPTLILGDRSIWRVPALLNLTDFGIVNTVGYIDVDAQTGQINPISSEQTNRMQEIAHAIAAHFSSQTALTG